MALAPGTRIGSYEIVSALGAGGMGEVYRARDSRLRRDVAIKVLLPAVAQDPERLARFDREAEILASLDHPNIAAIHGVEQSGASAALILEFVDGLTLADRIAAGAMPPAEALPIARQIADAVEAAHEKGIIHRDLKPANIKVRPDGTVKVLDFGLAKALEMGPGGQAGSGRVDGSLSPTLTSPVQMTGAGVILGTAAYMAPEQARGQAVDKRADIWAFGCVLFEMLTGTRAFQGDHVIDTLSAVVDKSPDWSRLPTATPDAVRRLLARCLEKDPRRRLRDIGEARLALERLDDPSAVSAPTVAQARGVRPAVAWALAGLAALAAAGATAAVLRSGPRPSADGRPFPYRVALPLNAGETTEPLRGLAASRDGRMVAFIARPAGGQPRLVIRRLDGGREVAVENTANAIYPFFSPDGQWVAFFSDDGLKTVPTAGGIPTVVAPLHTRSRGSGGAWADDGTIFFGRTDGIWKIRPPDGQPERVTEVSRDRGEISHQWPLVLDGSRSLLYVVWTGPGWDERNVVVRDLSSGNEKVLLKGAATVRYAASGHLIYSREGRLMAEAFDAARLEISGPPVPLFDDLREGAAAADYDVSPSGTLVYVHQSRGAYNRVPVLTDRTGRAQAIPGVPPGFYQNPRFSRDGRRALFQRADSTIDLWLYSFDRQTMTAIPSDGSNQNPQWSPDGQRVVYRGTRRGSRNLFVRVADGVSPEARLTDSPNVQLPWSWEAGVIAFAEQTVNGDTDIWLLRTDGNGVATPLLQTPFEETKPRLSPDGRMVAYVSDESGRSQVYLLGVDGRQREQVSAEGGTDPVWARSGRELFYRNGPRVMSVSVAPTGAVASPPRQLFEGNYVLTAPALDFDVSPDGERFLMIRTSEPEPPSTQIELLINWAETLKPPAAPVP